MSGLPTNRSQLINGATMTTMFKPVKDETRNRAVPNQIEHATEEPRPQVQRNTEQVLLGGGQLLVAVSAAILWQFCANAMGWNGERYYPDIPAGIQIFNACVIAALGLLSALLVIKLFPSAARSGRWAWVPLATILALLIGWDVLVDGWDWHLISDHYFWEYPAQKLGPIQRDILTYPALSAIAYSLGVLTRIVRSRKLHGE
jgi:hypothetical protein